MLRVPLEQALGAAAVLVGVEAPFAGRQVSRVLGAIARIVAAQHGGVDLEQQADVVQREEVDAARDVVVDQRVAGEHVGAHGVDERVAAFDEERAERLEVLLDLDQGTVDGAEVDAAGRAPVSRCGRLVRHRAQLNWPLM